MLRYKKHLREYKKDKPNHNLMKSIITTIALLIVSITTSFSQKNPLSVFKAEDINWLNADMNDNQIMGASVNKTYQKLLVNKKPKKTIIVALIDGGVDINHQDLQGKIWVNTAEIPGNNIDDDQNGYIDDMYGWNFIGNAKGENIQDENLEYTRVYESGVNSKDYEKAKILYTTELSKRTKEKENLTKFREKYTGSKQTIKEKTGIDVNKKEDLSTIISTDADVLEAAAFLKQKYENGFSEKSFLRREKRNAEYLEKYLNVNFNPREIIGDDPNNISDNHYGNPDVIGSRASHGTCLAGIIAAIRNNGIGIDGIATDVKIMVLRTTPNGDERDKDVALAIKYAVENGANIINMSFGKAISPQKNFVDEAIKFAEKKNVLIIHAAGNEGENIDKFTHYPSDTYLDEQEATNFINIGASGKQNTETIAAIFSNYGKNHVDIFAPGEDIISTDTNNTYSIHSGTSEAAPVVTGVAALILSYYPDLTPQELIAILLESATNITKKTVQIPDLENETRELVKFGDLCKSGGIINAFEAMKKAEKFKK
jgi:subtilisin family serine protease